MCACDFSSLYCYMHMIYGHTRQVQSNHALDEPELSSPLHVPPGSLEPIPTAGES